MTSDLTPRNRALVALKVWSLGLALATAPGPASAEVTANPAEATVFLRFACTEKVKEAPTDFDRALFPPEKKVGWGSGAFVREDGLLVTTDHSLAKLAQRGKKEIAGETITVGCDRDDITVDVFELDSITQALRGEQGKYRELANLRDASLADRDVLFLKADTRGHDVPWLCAPGTIELRDFDGLPITAAGVDNDLGQPQYVERKGRATDEWGAGEASKYLGMEPAAVEGMSGGPVVRRSDGALVGIVHGNRISSHPGATENYFVPLTKFGGHLRQYADPCAPKGSFEELLVLFDPKGENYIPEISDNKFRPVIEGTRNFLEAVFEGTANVVVGNRSYLKTALSDPDYLIDAWADDEQAHDLIKPGGKRKGILVKMIDQGTEVHLHSKLFSASDEPRPLAYDPWPLDNARPGLTPEEHTEQFGHHLVRELQSKDPDPVGFKPDPIFIDCIAPHDERGISPDVEKKLHNLSYRLAWLMDTDEEWRGLYWQSPDQGICASTSNESQRSRLDRLGVYPMPRYFLDTDVRPSRGDMLFIEVSGRFRWGARDRIGVHEVAAALDVSEGEDCLSSQSPPTMDCSLKNFLAEKLREYGQFASGGR